MDPYKVLGVNKKASKAQIKQAFRNLALNFHPDKHSHSSKIIRDNALLRFKQASLAYQILIDDTKRANYDLRSSSSVYANHNNNYHASSRNHNGS
ncbi:Chaperone protein dnaj, partial [Thalictrum thalictroides]